MSKHKQYPCPDCNNLTWGKWRRCRACAMRFAWQNPKTRSRHSRAALRLWQDAGFRQRRAESHIQTIELMVHRLDYPDRLMPEQEQVLLGSVLGDASLVMRGPRSMPAFVEHHCEAQKPYLLWKADVFSALHPRIGFSQGSGWRLLTGQAPLLLPYRRMFYPQGVKVVPDYALETLSPLGLAVWFMDDGSIKNGRTLVLSTEAWSLETQGRLAEWFASKWGARPRIDRCSTKPGSVRWHRGRPVRCTRQHHRLAFRVNESVALLRLIAPFVHPLFRAKWHLDFAERFRPALSHKERGKLGQKKIRTMIAAGQLHRPAVFGIGVRKTESHPDLSIRSTAALSLSGLACK